MKKLFFNLLCARSFYRVLGLFCGQIWGLFVSLPAFFNSFFTLLSSVDRFPGRWFHRIGFPLLIFFSSRQSARPVSSAPRSGFLPRCALVSRSSCSRGQRARSNFWRQSAFASLGFQLARFSTGKFAAVSSPTVASPFHFACAHKDSAPPASVVSSSQFFLLAAKGCRPVLQSVELPLRLCSGLSLALPFSAGKL
jgi:hypothetical protein